jgi:hypothetical protein
MSETIEDGLGWHFLLSLNSMIGRKGAFGQLD